MSYSNVFQAMESGFLPARRAVKERTEPVSTTHTAALQGNLQQCKEEPRLVAQTIWADSLIKQALATVRVRSGQHSGI